MHSVVENVYRVMPGSAESRGHSGGQRVAAELVAPLAARSYRLQLDLVGVNLPRSRTWPALTPSHEWRMPRIGGREPEAPGI